MSDTERTYIGPLPRGTQALPDRSVPFVKGVPVAFSADEAATLDPADWPTPKKTKATKATIPADPATIKEV